MKRFLICVLALLMAAAAGCTSSKQNEGKTSPTSTPSSHTTNAPEHQGGNKHRTDSPGAKKHTPEPSSGAGEIGTLEPQSYVVDAEACFKDGGFAFFVARATTQLTVNMDSNGTDAEWQIFVLDDKFEDSLRYLPQAYQPVLKESGSLAVEAGQYVYIYCTVNGFTSGEPAEGATVTFTGPGLPE